MPLKLYRLKAVVFTLGLENKMLCGVCGGIGEYFNIDPTIVRLIWAIFACSGPGIIAYFVAAIIIPLAPN
ncbi:PspC domain-containing protein [Enterocloster clostridioformis]|uniref:PspC domain-containing protein n=1 Tax=Enterocloster clostridioformis TaxID=1531 RepID=UPI00306C91DE|nr:PspC domain-containing protein [Enterocloster clostridioformis]